MKAPLFCPFSPTLVPSSMPYNANVDSLNTNVGCMNMLRLFLRTGYAVGMGIR